MIRLIILMVFMLPGISFAGVLGHEDSGVVHLSWEEEKFDTVHFKVSYEDLTEKSDTIELDKTFDKVATLPGFESGHIYRFMVKGYDRYSEYNEFVGDTYVAIGLNSNCSSGDKEDPAVAIENVIHYGVTGPIWWTGVAVCNAGDVQKAVVFSVGKFSEGLSVGSGECKTYLISDIVDKDGEYPVRLETKDKDIGFVVITGNHESGAIR